MLNAAIPAPHTDEGWRFILVDDAEIKSQFARLYRQAWQRLFDHIGVNLADLLQADTPHGRAARSGTHLAHHFHEVPLLPIGFGRSRGGGGIYPALWSAMLAARADGIGSTLTAVLQSFFADEVLDILGVPKDAGWYMLGVIPMGYPMGKWACSS